MQQHAIGLVSLVSCLFFQIWSHLSALCLVLYCVILLSFCFCWVLDYGILASGFLIGELFSVTVHVFCYICICSFMVCVCVLCLDLQFIHIVCMCQLCIGTTQYLFPFGLRVAILLVLVFASCAL